ncbi:cytochrome c3 family protein [Streptomyces sp. NPDC048281]|uniref:cytochrome c3 family protein n=1 Tax=Streptomyces sp. NPDC048281 TaxID=3154715 RepID=UPI003430F595
MMTEAPDLTKMTPVEIDTELSRLWDEEARADAKRLALVTSLHKAVGDEPSQPRGARYPIFKLSPERVWELAVMRARAPRVGEHKDADEIDRTLTNWALVSRKLEDLAAEIKSYVDEYVRRGRWNRVYLAKSHDGHAHNGQNCSTCHHGEEPTQFAWLVRYSGMTEAEIVADAGWRACTTCYPSAPLGDAETLPTKMYTPDEETAAKAREEREQAREQRAADKTTKGITAPDGTVLRDRHGSRIETERAAVIAATDGLSERYKNLRFEQILTADPALTPLFVDRDRRTDNEARDRADALRLIEAIAYKRGTTSDVVLAELEPKALAKAKRDLGGKDWAPRVRYSASFQTAEFDAYMATCKEEERKPFEALTLRWAKF